MRARDSGARAHTRRIALSVYLSTALLRYTFTYTRSHSVRVRETRDNDNGSNLGE